MSKAPDAFRTISEVSEILETPPHVLRFWETKFTQLKPVKRAGGRRYYRPSDLELLGGIKRLLHDDGMTIRGVQKMLREKGVKQVAALSPPLELDAATEDSSAAPIAEPTAQKADASDATASPVSETPAEDRPSLPPPEPPAPDREKTVKTATPALDSEAPHLPLDDTPEQAPAHAVGKAAADESAKARADAEALAARIRELSTPEKATGPAAPEQAPDNATKEEPPAEESDAETLAARIRDVSASVDDGKTAAPYPPADTGTPPPESPPIAGDTDAPAHPEADAEAHAEHSRAAEEAEGDDDSYPGIATILRRIDGPLPAARVRALRNVAARLESLNARLAEADEAATG